MISFGPTEEQEAIREAMHGFAESAMRTIARDCDEDSIVPDDFLEQVWQLGLTTTQVPEAFGGMGAERSPLTNAIALEELAWGDAALAVAATAPSLFVNALLDHGTDDQKRRLLPGLCGDRFALGSLAILEPRALADATRPATEAKMAGSGFFLSGTKRLVPFADRARHFLVLARVGEGLGALIVDRDTPGLRIAEAPDKNLGLRAVPLYTIELDHVKLAPDSLLGGERGCDLRRLLDTSRAAIATCLVGLARAVVDYCVPYAKDRVAFDEPIARKQAVAFSLADAHCEVEAMRWLAWKAASQLEQRSSATKACFQAWSYAGERGLWVADTGIQTLGGHGFIREHPVEMWFRNARTLGVLEGTLSI
jgi:alkylation response protein AidB-like acyl-CoA dehydrogenase